MKFSDQPKRHKSFQKKKEKSTPRKKIYPLTEEKNRDFPATNYSNIAFNKKTISNLYSESDESNIYFGLNEDFVPSPSVNDFNSSRKLNNLCEIMSTKRFM